MSHDSKSAHSSRNGGRSIVRTSFAVTLVVTLSAAATACSSGDSSSPTTAITVPATTTTIAATTTTSTTSTTLAPTTTTTTLPTIDTSVLADVVAAAALGPVPEGTDIQGARGDISPLEDNGCHVGWGATAPSNLPCEFGDTTSDVVIVLTGDSHAAAWFGTFDEAAKANGWKLVTVTKRGCPIADVRVFSAINREILNAPYPECDTWREAAIQHIIDLRPALVAFPMLTRRGAVGFSGANAIREWGEGLGRTLDAIGTSGAKLLVVGDTPKTMGDNVPLCVSNRQQDIARCANTRSKAVLDERLASLAATAPAHHATYLDVSNWFCTDAICPVVINGIVVYSDDSHLTDTYARYRSPQMTVAIQVALGTSP